MHIPFRSLFISLLTFLTLPAQATEPPFSFNVPQLEHIQIDGEDTDWNDGGLVVAHLEALAGVSNEQSKFRCAWDNKGLLLYITVEDSTPHEYAETGGLYMMDSVELFFSDAFATGLPPTNYWDRNIFQVVIGPGHTEAQKELRLHFFDNRHENLKTTTPRIDIERKILPNGYAMEIRLPWEMLNLAPHENHKVGLQVQVNNHNGTENSQQRWNATPGKGYILYLGDNTSAPIKGIAYGEYPGLTNAQATVHASREASGKMVKAYDSETLLAKATLEENKQANKAILTWDIDKMESGIVRIEISDTPTAFVEFDDYEKAKEKIFNQTTVTIVNTLFNTEKLPTPKIMAPDGYEEFANTLSIETQYYNADFKETEKAEESGRYGVHIILTDNADLKRNYYTTIYRTGPKDFQNLTADLRTLNAEWIEKAKSQSMTDDDQYFGHTPVAIHAALNEVSGEKPHAQPGPRDANWWYEWRKAHGIAKPYADIVQLPEYYHPSNQKAYPLLVYLHGSGGGGQDWHERLGIYAFTQGKRRVPLIIASPLSPNEDRWIPNKLADYIESLKLKYNIDDKRIYLTGFSMGGFGGWNMVNMYPNMFAAFAPSASQVDTSILPSLTHIPIRIYNGTLDHVASAEEVENYLSILKEHGSTQAEVIHLEGVDHAVAPEATYNNDEFYKWIQKHSKN